MNEAAFQNEQANPLEIIENALRLFEFSDDQISITHKLIAIILHLGNIDFEENGSGAGCKITFGSKNSYRAVGKLLNTEIFDESLFVSRTINVGNEKIR